MPEQRLTLRLAGHVYFTQGQYSETIPAEMGTADVRRALTRLAEYEDACFDDDGHEVVDTHAIHVLRGEKPTSLRDWTPCAEGLPEERSNDQSDDVLICYVNKHGMHLVSTGWYWSEQKHWYQTNGDVPVEVIAWQPLPDPYNPDHIRDAGKGSGK